VTVLDEKGTPLGVSRPIIKDVTDATVEWTQPDLLAKFKGQTIQLKFELKSAKLYAFRF